MKTSPEALQKPLIYFYTKAVLKWSLHEAGGGVVLLHLLKGQCVEDTLTWNRLGAERDKGEGWKSTSLHTRLKECYVSTLVAGYLVTANSWSSEEPSGRKEVPGSGLVGSKELYIAKKRMLLEI